MGVSNGLARPLGTVVVAIVALANVVLAGCDSGPTPKAIKAAEWLEKHFKKFPVGGGWILVRAEVKSDDVFLKFHVPVDQGNAIMAQDIRVQLNLIGGIACPSRLEPVWEILGPDGDIWINPAVNRQIFSDVPCRDYGQ